MNSEYREHERDLDDDNKLINSHTVIIKIDTLCKRKLQRYSEFN